MGDFWVPRRSLVQIACTVAMVYPPIWFMLWCSVMSRRRAKQCCLGFAAMQAAMAQQTAQVGPLLKAEAGLQLAGAGQTHPVAAAAEFPADRSDESDPPQQPAAGPVAGGTAAPALVHLVQVGVGPLQPHQGLRRANARHGRPQANGHQLDEAHIHRQPGG